MQSRINTISEDKYLPVRKFCISEVSTSFYETVSVVEYNKCCVLKCIYFIVFELC